MEKEDDPEARPTTEEKHLGHRRRVQLRSGSSCRASVFAGYLIGYWLDKKFGTTYLYLVFMVLGIISGFIQIFRFLKKHED